MKNKKVLITGVLGFIGSHLAEELVNQGAIVVGMDNGSTGKINNIVDFQQKIFLCNGDVNYMQNVETVFNTYGPFDYIFHLAAVVGVKNTEEKPIKVLADSYGITNLISYIGNYPTKVVYASSSEVYGHTNPPLKELGLTDIQTPYQTAKIFGEQLCKACSEKENIRTVALRYFNVYGPRQEGSAYGFVTSIFIHQALNGQSLTVFDDGNQTRDFTYVKDTVNLTIKAAKNAKTNGKVINVGTGRPTTIKELAKQVEKIIRPTQTQITYINERKGEIRNRWANVKLMKKLLGSPKYSLAKGLKETIKYYQGKN